VVAALVLAAVIVFAVMSTSHQNAVTLPSSYPDALAPGSVAPAFSLPRLGGGAPVVLSGYRGTAVVLNFFASWCPHCGTELSSLAALARTTAGRVAVVGVDSDDRDASATQRLLATAQATYPVAIDAQAQISTQYLLTGLPATYVIGSDGRILGAAFGPQSAARLSGWVDSLTTGSVGR
jgi:peroxiredoxin